MSIDENTAAKVAKLARIEVESQAGTRNAARSTHVLLDDGGPGLEGVAQHCEADGG